MVDEAAAVEEPDAVLSVPEIRDYDTINAELIRLLDHGKRWIRLDGVSGQRLLASRLVGEWNAVVEVAGRAGPELAAQTNASGLSILCRGPAGDGVASGLRAGRVLVLGHAGAAFGYSMVGGEAIVLGTVGARAGLGQRCGTLILLGDAGAMAGERQSGGRLYLGGDLLGPHVGWGRRGGRLVSLMPRDLASLSAEIDTDDRVALESARNWVSRIAAVNHRVLSGF